MRARSDPLCKDCNEPFYRNTSFQVRCLPCLVGKIRKDRVKTDAKKAKVKKAGDRAFKKKVQTKDVAYQHKLTKTRFNRMRVLEELLWFMDRGIEPYCISCRKTKMDWSCGHYKTVGSQGNLRYDRMNTYLQCLGNCNSHRSGNIGGTKTSVGYTEGLLVRFGETEGQRIIDYCVSHTETVKWDGEWLIDFRAKCAARIRLLERQYPQLTPGRGA